jgi:ABC-type dipeptide/oligopeptide/nickel transport system ATPase component
MIEGAPVYQMTNKQLQELRKKKISFIFQDPVGSLAPTATVGKQLLRTISYRMEISDNAECATRAKELLSNVGLQETDRVWHSYPSQLSGGMCQRVMIALALSVRPSLLIADEAVSSLDAITQSRVLSLLRDLQSEYGFGMMFVTHDLRVAAHVSTHVGVMRAGRLVELKSTAKLYRDPELQYSKELIESAKELSL